MKRLKIFIVIFCVALSIPLAYLVLQTYRGLAQEEESTLRYFAETLFDEMEKELTSLVIKEEGRAIDEYNYRSIPSGLVPGSIDATPSPLSRLPENGYIIGYFQNNPDGSFQTPLVENEKNIPGDKIGVVAQLKEINKVFNTKRFSVAKTAPAPVVEPPLKQKEKQPAGFADRYFDLSKSQKSKSYLGRKEKRVEQITMAQAQRIAPQQKAPQDKDDIAKRREDSSGTISGDSSSWIARNRVSEAVDENIESEEPSAHRQDTEGMAAQAFETKKYQVEVAPLQSIFIDRDKVFIFRRIMINNQIYRQGFILQTRGFLQHLADMHFAGQPLARYTNLSLKVADQGIETEMINVGAATQRINFMLDRTFPSPFAFLNASLVCEKIPRSAGRGTLNIIIGLLAVVVLMGLFAIYQSAKTVVDLSERRSNFVSSVTHELKTPLTNIRMYIEMLEQGIAKNRDREQDYFGILGSESERLSRLIDNVLELSKLEKKQRHIHMKEDTFEDVVNEVQTVMQEKLRQEGFTLTVDMDEVRSFKYDREVMILILINLLENSMKFGQEAATREIALKVQHETDRVNVSVSDTGPGIPRHALKKIFDDFYRVEGPLTRKTGGTGIGLALVKKFVDLMGGMVYAENNSGPGCTITIYLPNKINI